MRNLKSQKAAKSEVDNAVKILLTLKTDYKKITNTDWKPGCVPPAETPASPNATDVDDDLNAKLSSQADKVQLLLLMQELTNLRFRSVNSSPKKPKKA